MYAFVDMYDYHLTSIMNKLMIHAMIANEDIILNNKGLYLDINNYTMRDCITYQKMERLLGNKIKLDKKFVDITADYDSTDNPLFTALSESYKFHPYSNVTELIDIISAEICDGSDMMTLQQRQMMSDYCKIFDSFVVSEFASFNVYGSLSATIWFFGTILFDFPIEKIVSRDTIYHIMQSFLFKIETGIYSTAALPEFSNYTGDMMKYAFILTNYYNELIKKEPFKFCTFLTQAAIFISDNNILDGQTFNTYLESLLRGFMPATDMTSLNNIYNNVFRCSAILVKDNLLDRDNNFIKGVDHFTTTYEIRRADSTDD